MRNDLITMTVKNVYKLSFDKKFFFRRSFLNIICKTLNQKSFTYFSMIVVVYPHASFYSIFFYNVKDFVNFSGIYSFARF